MAASKRHLFHAFRLSRKLVLIASGGLLILGASGTAALVISGPANLIPGMAEEEGGFCKTVYHSAFRRIDEKRIIAVIQTDDRTPDERIATGLRLARHIAEAEHPDLLTIQLTDVNGPTGRADLRGDAIGTEIVHAPNPNKTRATDREWEIRYIDAEPSELGYFYGLRIDMEDGDIARVQHSLAEAEPFTGCAGDIVETAEAGAGAGGHGGAAKPKADAGHGKAASSGH